MPLPLGTGRTEARSAREEAEFDVEDSRAEGTQEGGRRGGRPAEGEREGERGGAGALGGRPAERWWKSGCWRPRTPRPRDRSPISLGCISSPQPRGSRSGRVTPPVGSNRPGTDRTFWSKRLPVSARS